VLRAARWKCRTQKIAKNSPSGHHCTTLSGYIFATKARVDNGKKLLNSNMFSTCSHNTVNFGPLAAEICRQVLGTPTNFNGFCFLAELLHGTLVVGASQTFRRWTDGATYNRQGGHPVGHCPTFLHCDSKKRSTFTTCYNFYIHSSIATIFGTNVAEKVGNQNAFYFPTTPHYCFCSTCVGKQESQKLRLFT